MPRLRLKTKERRPQLGKPKLAICMTEFRPAPVAARIAKGQQLPLDHPVVQAHPEFFMGLVRLDEGVNDA
jgi:hypothetical protein